VHGTFANENLSWQTLAPLLSDAGYCVFGLNYGATSGSHRHAYGLDAIEHSAVQLETFIASVVLPDTVEPEGNAAGYAAGARPLQVDVVGHSQGGMMPRYLIDTTGSRSFPGLGHPALVHTLVGLAPSNHGSDGEGLVPVFARLFGNNVYTFPASTGCPACRDQEAGSPFLRALNARPDAPGVNYYVIETRHDRVVTPYTSAFLTSTANAQNVTLQDQCPTDVTDHIGILYDPVALGDVMEALANNGNGATPLARPPCPPVVAPVVSG
jgi:triacylglycerol esterase/lipase EstA (alpha/beta hydrolase family)